MVFLQVLLSKQLSRKWIFCEQGSNTDSSFQLYECEKAYYRSLEEEELDISSPLVGYGEARVHISP
jgi:hypothetical protein